jgi:TfoX/Sxy family transcriptional regulator of competence genes
LAFDPGLAQRVREALGGRRGVSERRMFGGIAFLVDGKMFVGIRDASLMARVGPERHADALAVPGVRVMDFTGRPLTGYVYVDPPAIADDAQLQAWVLRCVRYVAGLPAKKAQRAQR